jgi:hypothetical protein
MVIHLITIMIHLITIVIHLITIVIHLITIVIHLIMIMIHLITIRFVCDVQALITRTHVVVSVLAILRRHHIRNVSRVFVHIECRTQVIGLLIVPLHVVPFTRRTLR